jgi:hypothetical protein
MTTAISRAWSGKERLAIVFWYYAFLGAIAVSLLSGWAFKAADTADIKVVGSVLNFLTFIAVLAYSIWVAVALWRCALNVGRQLWSNLARLVALAQVAGTVYWLYEVTLWILDPTT